MTFSQNTGNLHRVTDCVQISLSIKLTPNLKFMYHYFWGHILQLNRKQSFGGHMYNIMPMYFLRKQLPSIYLQLYFPSLHFIVEVQINNRIKIIIFFNTANFVVTRKRLIF